MASFGFSVGDFLALGQLISQVATELRKNGEAAPEYQHLLIELEALDRALHQLQALKPAKNEVFQLTAIRATAVACKIPLEEFLQKVSKFEKRLGSFTASSNKWKGLPRRMQFRVMFREDVKALRSVLSGHVATINLLLLTQTVASISAAENDRNCFQTALKKDMAVDRMLLQNVHAAIESSRSQQEQIETQLQDQTSALDGLAMKADRTLERVTSQETRAHEIQQTAIYIKQETQSILGTVTSILTVITSGVARLRELQQNLATLLQLCVTFAGDVRATMGRLMELFLSLQATLARIEGQVSPRVCPQVIRLTTALGDTLALPLQLCQEWSTFRDLIKLLFRDKPEYNRVRSGMYMISKVDTRRPLSKGKWEDAVRPGDHFHMFIFTCSYEGRSLLMASLPSSSGDSFARQIR